MTKWPDGLKPNDQMARSRGVNPFKIPAFGSPIPQKMRRKNYLGSCVSKSKVTYKTRASTEVTKTSSASVDTDSGEPSLATRINLAGTSVYLRTNVDNIEGRSYGLLVPTLNE